MRRLTLANPIHRHAIFRTHVSQARYRSVITAVHHSCIIAKVLALRTWGIGDASRTQETPDDTGILRDHHFGAWAFPSRFYDEGRAVNNFTPASLRSREAGGFFAHRFLKERLRLRPATCAPNRVAPFARALGRKSLTLRNPVCRRSAHLCSDRPPPGDFRRRPFPANLRSRADR